jgi:hypothetical protein
MIWVAQPRLFHEEEMDGIRPKGNSLPVRRSHSGLERLTALYTSVQIVLTRAWRGSQPYTRVYKLCFERSII